MTSLNARQMEAVRAISGPVLVLAGAGSGKTSVITRKIAYLIQECGYSASRIMAVTFTNKAAREMRHRASSLLQKGEGRGLVVSTFHAMGLEMLRKEAQHADRKSNFSIFDAEDSRSLLAELMQRDLASATDRIDQCQSLISRFKNLLWSPDDALNRAQNEDEELAAKVYEAYTRHLHAYNAVDFDDLVLMPTLLLRDHADIRERWQHRVRYLLVDEYQDTNATQYELVRLLVGAQANFTVVGDDDQSIYAWRGAQPENMNQLLNDYPGLRVIKLEQNYRSTSRILRSANQVIANNPHVFEKRLWSEHGVGDRIRVLACRNEQAEAERIAIEILNARMMRRIEFREFAVLYRSNFQARILELELRKLQIPYRVSGGTSFFSRQEIKDLMAYLRLVINPDDDNAFLRVINTPRRDIGPSTLEKLGSYARQRGVGLMAACDEMGLGSVLPERSLSPIRTFYRWFQEITRSIIETNEIASIRQMLMDIDYDSWLQQSSTTPAQAERKLDNVQQFLASMLTVQERAETEEDRSLEMVIRRMVLRDLLESQAQEEDMDRVQLLTLHAAKGLEFHHVFMMGMEENILPHQNSLDPAGLEEERRLMYVGITRAQQSLTFSYAQQRKSAGRNVPTTPSRFLDELVQDDLDWEGRGPERTAEEKMQLAQQHLSSLRQLLGDD